MLRDWLTDIYFEVEIKLSGFSDALGFGGSYIR